MTEDQKSALEKAHKALFAIDRLLAETYTPAKARLQNMHESIFQARRSLELHFGCEP